MFPAAHRYRAESDRTNVANKVSCFPSCTRKREGARERGRETEEHELVISELRVTTVTIKRGGLWSALGPETLCISLYEKSLLSAFHGILSRWRRVSACVSTELVHRHNLLSRPRIVTLLPPPLSSSPALSTVRTASEEIFHRIYALDSPSLPCRILDRFSDNFLYFSSHTCLSPVSIGVTGSQNERETTNGNAANGYKYMVYTRQK